MEEFIKLLEKNNYQQELTHYEKRIDYYIHRVYIYDDVKKGIGIEMYAINQYHKEQVLYCTPRLYISIETLQLLIDILVNNKR